MCVGGSIRTSNKDGRPYQTLNKIDEYLPFLLTFPLQLDEFAKKNERKKNPFVGRKNLRKNGFRPHRPPEHTFQLHLNKSG